MVAWESLRVAGTNQRPHLSVHVLRCRIGQPCAVSGESPSMVRRPDRARWRTVRSEDRRATIVAARLANRAWRAVDVARRPSTPGLLGARADRRRWVPAIAHPRLKLVPYASGCQDSWDHAARD